eukprot:TRINITY_DN7799_c0_g4_i1.p1 TRINITY_DN7799_c0_g4~~TRINITY_DN7799_c0_g4_i1.p1  ORF type:complete len:101 (-),score=18.06 TRINITY_DN7799_c0_g4_i1:124-426(-)
MPVTPMEPLEKQPEVDVGAEGPQEAAKEDSHGEDHAERIVYGSGSSTTLFTTSELGREDAVLLCASSRHTFDDDIAGMERSHFATTDTCDFLASVLRPMK